MPFIKAESLEAFEQLQAKNWIGPRTSWHRTYIDQPGDPIHCTNFACAVIEVQPGEVEITGVEFQRILNENAATNNGRYLEAIATNREDIKADETIDDDTRAQMLAEVDGAELALQPVDVRTIDVQQLAAPLPVHEEAAVVAMMAEQAHVDQAIAEGDFRMLATTGMRLSAPVGVPTDAVVAFTFEADRVQAETDAAVAQQQRAADATGTPLEVLQGLIDTAVAERAANPPTDAAPSA